MEAEFYSDAIDDCRDFFAAESPAPEVPPIAPLGWREYCAKARFFAGLQSSDFGFLAAVDSARLAYPQPEQHRSLSVEAAQLFAQGSYQSVQGAYNALRCTLHQTEVL